MTPNRLLTLTHIVAFLRQRVEHMFLTSAILSDGLIFVIQKPWREQQTNRS
jgi:hypothetical protein